jgi:hypothetical protein
MVKCATEDSCNNPWVLELIAFESARVRALFPGWERKDVIALLGFAVLDGLTIASPRGLLIALPRDGQTFDVFTIFGERGFLKDALRVWRDLYPKWTVRGRRQGHVRLFNLTDFKQYGISRN